MSSFAQTDHRGHKFDDPSPQQDVFLIWSKDHLTLEYDPAAISQNVDGHIFYIPSCKIGPWWF